MEALRPSLLCMAWQDKYRVGGWKGVSVGDRHQYACGWAGLSGTGAPPSDSLAWVCVWSPFSSDLSQSCLRGPAGFQSPLGGFLGAPAGSGDGVWSPTRAPTLPLTSCVTLGVLTVQSLGLFLYKIGVKWYLCQQVWALSKATCGTHTAQAGTKPTADKWQFLFPPVQPMADCRHLWLAWVMMIVSAPNWPVRLWDWI